MSTHPPRALTSESSVNCVHANQLAFPEVIEPKNWRDVTLNDFQQLSMQTLLLEPGNQREEATLTHLLAGELQEVANKLEASSDYRNLPPAILDGVALELGDCLWYYAQVSRVRDLTLGNAAQLWLDFYPFQNYREEVFVATGKIITQRGGRIDPLAVHQPDMFLDDYQDLIARISYFKEFASPRDLAGLFRRFANENTAWTTIDNPEQHFRIQFGVTLSLIAETASRMGIALSDVAERNSLKLRSRLMRDQIFGEGDYR
jgi:NTP pyrophosphatase (non-canonical NTP hydrolase)